MQNSQQGLDKGISLCWALLSTFDPRSRSIRKGCDGEAEVEKEWIVKIAVHYRRASQLREQRPTGTPIARANNLI